MLADAAAAEGAATIGRLMQSERRSYTLEQARKRVAVIGDCALDVVVRPERPVLPAGDVPAQIRIGIGGQGANVAVRLHRRGIAVRLVAPVGEDAAGRLLHEALAAEGLEIHPAAAARSTVVVALIDASGERSMLSDRLPLDLSALSEALVGVEWVHVSAYALRDDGAGDGLAELLGELTGSVRVSVAGGSLPSDREVGARFVARLRRSRADLLVASADEAANLVGRPLGPGIAGLRDAARALGELVGPALPIVTGGALGSAAPSVSVSAEDGAGPVVDATGAGDGYVAALIGELLVAAWPPADAPLRGAMQAASRLGSAVARVHGAQGLVAGERGG